MPETFILLFILFAVFILLWLILFVFACGIVTLTVFLYTLQNLLGGYCVGVPPLPIPNREVKPNCADGTAMQCGRVGSCLFSLSLDYDE